MKAKDVKWCPQHGYPLPCDKCGLGEYERGKKEGIKEVVEWVNSHKLYAGNVSIPAKTWQVKLKEWGG